MSAVFKRAARLLVLASFLVSTGMHTAVLQAAAWAKMTVAFARRDTLSVSLAKTFDGRHPCAVCRSLKEADDPSSLVPAPAHSSLVFAAPTAAPRVGRPSGAWDVAMLFSSPSERAFVPVSPPPKAVLS